MQNKHIIKSIDLIDLNTKTIINNFTKTASINNIKGIANFLRENFAIDITTEKDIIKGFSSDWSNMKGNADALCRPKNILECVITIKVCYLLQIPMTISAGRTNLTGSATPQGGIIISINKTVFTACKINKNLI